MKGTVNTSFNETKYFLFHKIKRKVIQKQQKKTKKKNPEKVFFLLLLLLLLPYLKDSNHLIFI